MKSVQSMRKKFPALNCGVYANTASTGLLNQDLVEWRQEHDLDFLIGGSIAREEQAEIIPGTRQAISKLFGCDEKNIALVQNFTLGLNILLEGIDRKCKVLLLENDYPSLNWPFEKRGFPIFFTEITKELERDIFEKIKLENIDILALSLVQWQNGIKIDLTFLKKLKEEFPELIIIADGTQFCGAFEFNFETSGIDVLGTSGYKWLLSGFGNGFMLFKEEIQKKLKVHTIGYYSTGTNIKAKDTFRFAKHFEPGHLDSLNFGSLNFSLEMLSQIGIENIEAYNKELMENAKAKFSALELLSETVMQRPHHSTIFNIRAKEHVFRVLTDNNVICSQRGDGIRLSFHMYNTVDEVSQIADLLKSII